MEIFRCSRHPDHIDWLINRIRPYQHKNKLAFQQFQQKLDLIILLQLLIYVRTLDYQTKTLRSNFRQFKFPLSDFLNYSSKASNHYQLMKLKRFFNVLKKNLVMECFTDKSYRMLVTIPEAFIHKSEQNIWIVEVWVAEELFDYLHPFIFPDFFKEKLTIDEFHVLFEIIHIFSSSSTRKEFYIQEFLKRLNVPNKKKTQLKQMLIEAIYQQINNKLMQLQFKIIQKDGSIQKINKLQTQDISQINLIYFYENVDYNSLFKEKEISDLKNVF